MSFPETYDLRITIPTGFPFEITARVNRFTANGKQIIDIITTDPVPSPVPDPSVIRDLQLRLLDEARQALGLPRFEHLDRVIYSDHDGELCDPTLRDTGRYIGTRVCHHTLVIRHPETMISTEIDATPECWITVEFAPETPTPCVYSTASACASAA